VLDASQPLLQEDRELLAQVKNRRAIVVENKIDQSAEQMASSVAVSASLTNVPEPQDVSGVAISGVQTGDSQTITENRHSQPGNWQLATGNSTGVRTSAVTGEGIAELRAAILKHVGGDAQAQQESGFLTNARHQGLVRDSLRALTQGETAVRENVPHEMLLLDLYAALRPLDEITGVTTADDILNLIFGSFCIGK
jgi:tRNA modification GTPase